MSTLIADSGGTKTDWAFLSNGEPDFFSGSGLHPAYMTVDQIENELDATVSVTPEQIFFYGAGCHGSGPASKLERAILRAFPDANLEVNDDLTGVARAHLRQYSGLIASLGTGSICGRYDSGQILKRSAALGYAIGDEGSAADLGRTILKSFFRHLLDKETSEIVADRLNNRSYSEWMDQIYNSDRPNRELAAVAGRVFINPLTNDLREIILSCFSNFIDAQFCELTPEKDEKIVCSGSVAVAHAGILLDTMSNRGFENVSIKENVIEGLVHYHS
jgi:N-acetylglucosamine kinase-like BadF-type ATPase